MKFHFFFLYSTRDERGNECEIDEEKKKNKDRKLVARGEKGLENGLFLMSFMTLRCLIWILRVVFSSMFGICLLILRRFSE